MVIFPSFLLTRPSIIYQMITQFITPDLAKFPAFLKNIESKWRTKLLRRFERERFVGDKQLATNQKPARYVLSMFPYPSGRLHLGHVRIYTSGDILVRYSKLLSNNKQFQVDFSHVIHPMGFDSFGLPAENAARERGLNPATWTNDNIRSMKKQLDDLAIQFDWREATSNPRFYKWTQHLFLKLMDAGLVYKSFAQVNWDPVDKTVLADEQVDEEGRSWRSNAFVEKRYLRQWFIKVNSFTNDIYKAEEVDPETWLDVLAIQRNWIGQPCGWMFYLPLRDRSGHGGYNDILPVFTKNPELFLMNGTRLSISSDHWLRKVYHVSGNDLINNPFTGRDMIVSVEDNPEDLPSNTKATLRNSNVDVESVATDNLLRGQVLLQARLNNLGGYFTSDKYRDWLVSRQRFWGTPIPVAYCSGCGHQGVPRESLPVTLPAVMNLKETVESVLPQTDDHQVISPLREMAPDHWVLTECPSCKSQAKRECETFDTLFDSSWYFLRYSSNPLEDKPFDPERVQPVWSYIGGKEHAAMHLFYARFITHFLHSLGELRFKEPFKSLLVQGVVKSRTYKLDGKYISKAEAESHKGYANVTVEYEKMSKSKGNGVDPQELIDTYGIDATRFCLMSYANPRTERLWRSNDEEFREVLSYLRRVTLSVQQYIDIGRMLQTGLNSNEKLMIKIKELSKDDLHLRKLLLKDARNRCAIDAMFNIQETNQFRQYISALHVLTSSIRNNISTSAVYTREFANAMAALIIMLNPLTPHLSEELWYQFSRSAINPLKLDSSTYKISMNASDQPWPIPDIDHNRSQCVRRQVQQLVN